MGSSAPPEVGLTLDEAKSILALEKSHGPMDSAYTNRCIENLYLCVILAFGADPTTKPRSGRRARFAR